MACVLGRMRLSQRATSKLPRLDGAMDFMMDGLTNGRMMRTLNVFDAHTLECLALEAETADGADR